MPARHSRCQHAQSHSPKAHWSSPHSHTNTSSRFAVYHKTYKPPCPSLHLPIPASKLTHKRHPHIKWTEGMDDSQAPHGPQWNPCLSGYSCPVQLLTMSTYTSVEHTQQKWCCSASKVKSCAFPSPSAAPDLGKLAAMSWGHLSLCRRPWWPEASRPQHWLSLGYRYRGGSQPHCLQVIVSDILRETLCQTTCAKLTPHFTKQ